MTTTAQVDSMCADAAAATGLDDFGDEWFLGPLTAWASDLEQPMLSDAGRSFLRSQAVRDLARRLRVLDVLRANPEIADVAIPPIVYVTGLARSGTTLLHNLLALHPSSRVFRRWELVAPVPPPDAATYDRDPRIAQVQASVDRQRGTFLERMHWVNAADPEECAWAFLDANSMLGQAPLSWMPAWRAAITGGDQTPTFENHRRLVQLLLWKHPLPPDGFLVLKSPQIARHLAQFAAVFPEATFVLMHRDPFRCTVSLAALCDAVGSSFVAGSPLADDGRRDRLTLTENAAALESITAFSDACPERTVHVAYPDLVHDPATVVADVLGCDLGRAVADYLARQRSGERASPPAQLDTMGYDHDHVWTDPAVASYVATFGVAREQQRLTG